MSDLLRSIINLLLPIKPGKPPAKLRVEETSITSGSSLDLRLEADEGEKFRGFLVQARDASNLDQQVP